MPQPLDRDRHGYRPQPRLEPAAPRDAPTGRVLVEPAVELVECRLGVPVVPGEEPGLGEPWQVLQPVQLPDPLRVAVGPVVDARSRFVRPPEAGTRVEVPVDGFGEPDGILAEEGERSVEDGIGRPDDP